MNLFNYINTIFAVIGFIFVFCIIAGFIAYKLDRLMISVNVDEKE